MVSGIFSLSLNVFRTCINSAFHRAFAFMSSDADGTFLTAEELQSLKDQLKTDEGYKDEIYIDTEGYPTFGIGHLIRLTDEEYGKPVGTKVKDERIQEVFEADVHIATQEVLVVFPSANTFPGEVKEILINMMFNLGRPRLKKFKNFIAAVNEGDWNRAADEMVDSLWYKQVKGRAERLVARMRAVASNAGN